MTTPISVVNEAGRSFTAILRLPEDKLWSLSTQDHTRERQGTEVGQTLVEIFDATYAGHPHFGPHGQLVASFYMAEFVNIDNGRGLNMGVPEWVLSGYNVTVIAEHLLRGSVDAIKIPADG